MVGIVLRIIFDIYNSIFNNQQHQFHVAFENKGRRNIMYGIQKTSYGYKLKFGGFIQDDEMKKWVEESKRTLLNKTGKFGIFVDMRELKPLDSNSQAIMREGQKLYKDKGMERSVVIVSTALTRSQFKRIAKETGIYQWERYIDTSSNPDWEKAGIDWIKYGKDPDK